MPYNEEPRWTRLKRVNFQLTVVNQWLYNKTMVTQYVNLFYLYICLFIVVLTVKTSPWSLCSGEFSPWRWFLCGYIFSLYWSNTLNNLKLPVFAVTPSLKPTEKKIKNQRDKRRWIFKQSRKDSDLVLEIIEDVIYSYL